MSDASRNTMTTKNSQLTDVDAVDVAALDVISVVKAVRSKSPLVHCLCPTVSMQIIADGLNAAGARPMMTETIDEAPVMNRVANALLINLGTLSTDGRAGIIPTIEAANTRGIPWVLDPAAVGVAPVRTAMAPQLLTAKPAVIRANASEVGVLAGSTTAGSGPDSLLTPGDVEAQARQLAVKTRGVVMVSGAVDYLTDGTKETRISRGDAMLTRVTGTGCLLGALTAACASVSNPWLGAITANYWLCLAAELAATHARKLNAGPGTFRTLLLDALDGVATDTELISKAVAS